MGVQPFTLVLVSAVTHAYWNFVLKRSGGSQTFVALSKVGEVVLFAPVFLAATLRGTVDLRALGGFAPVGALLVVGNYALLAAAYRRGELSLVYPVSRGGVLLFLPVMGWLVARERVSAAGCAAFALILGGIGSLHLPSLDLRSLAGLGARLRSPSVPYALAAALTAACYTLWDKRAVQALPAFAYFYAYTTLAALALGAAVLGRRPRGEVLREWRSHRGAILQVGFFNTVTYLLVLAALRGGTSSYVVAVRQLSIAVGVFLGWLLLEEAVGAPKVAGVVLVLLGCALISFTPAPVPS